ncbi:hypothetical protein [Parasphingorhabdus sp.]|jgi:hypothetical protein|uniref:hypothetical protein n=1 Tax=Parasphingorhabdus sp. TaxID=2709688 RepID=UPI0039E30E91
MSEDIKNPLTDYETRRRLSLAMLCSGMQLRPRAAQFLGGLTVDRNPLSEKQANWFLDLMDKFSEFDQAQRLPKAGDE